MSGTIVSIFPSINANGLIDEFGTGQIVNNEAAYFSIPLNLSSQLQSSWSLLQWGQSTVLNPNGYQLFDTPYADDVFHTPIYCWSNPSTSESFSIFNGDLSTPESGTVYGLEDGNGINEADIFLTSPNIPANTYNFGNPLTFSMNAKISKAIFSYLPGSQENQVTGNIDVGFEVVFDGAGGLPGYSGFVQIDPMTHNVDPVSDYNPTASYEYSYSTGPMSQTNPSQFIYSNVFSGDASLPGIASDSLASMDTLTYNVNKYVYNALQDEFVNFSSANQSVLLNLSNWSLVGLYVGLATSNQQTGTGVNGNADLGVQFSDITVTSDQSAQYDPLDPPAPVALVDTNPQMSFYDYTMGIGGSVDGAYEPYSNGTIFRYIYVGSDTLSLNAPAGQDWIFGGGSGTTILSAVSGNNTFIASTGTSTMTSGSGSDTFMIPYAPFQETNEIDTIVNFHLGDQVILEGVTSDYWNYGWTTSPNGDLTFTATYDYSPNVEVQLTFDGLQQSNLNEFVVGPGTSQEANLWAGCIRIALSSGDATQHAAAAIAGNDIINLLNVPSLGSTYSSSPIYRGSKPINFTQPLDAISSAETVALRSSAAGIIFGKDCEFDFPNMAQTGIPSTGDFSAIEGGRETSWLYNVRDTSVCSGLLPQHAVQQSHLTM